MPRLLDVNVLLAFAWPNHEHHQRVTEWFREEHIQGWATCPLVESGFVRVSSLSRITPEAVTPIEAMELLRRIRLLPGHEFWVDNFSISATPSSLVRGHRQVTDYHLLCLARSRGGKLVTLDQGVAALVPPGHAVNEYIVQL